MDSTQRLGSMGSAWANAGNQRAARSPGGADGASFQDKLFSRLDADSSGGVERGELQGLLDSLSNKLGSTVGGSDAFATMDASGDGSLDKTELATGLKSALSKVADTVSFARMHGAEGAPD